MTLISECIDKAQRALERSGRRESVNDITFVVASKSQPASRILEVIEELASYRIPFVLGENYVQEWEKKRTPVLAAVSCHLIGHVQSNKLKKASVLFSCIETVDSITLAQKIVGLKYFIQCNVSRDTAKHGVMPEQLVPLLNEIKALGSINGCEGLMAITKQYASGEEVRKDFRAMRSFGNEMELLYNRKVSLSMGMSQDYEIALEEGATHIRLGTALFGSRLTT